MKNKLTSPWAQTPSTQRREPSTGEVTGGFPCGPADQLLFNELEYRRSQAEAELVNIITSAGLTPNENILTQVLDALRIIFPSRPTGNLTLYVRTDGNDANDGMANTAGGAFKTILAAITAAQTKYYLPPGSLVTIQLGNDGVYDPPGTLNLGSNKFRIVGNTSNKTARQIFGTISGANSIVSLSAGQLELSWLNINNGGTGGYGVSTSGSAVATLNNVNFVTPSASTSGHVWAAGNSSILLDVGTQFSGSAAYALLAFTGSIIVNSNLTVSGSPAFSSAFAAAQSGGNIQFSQGGLSIAGSATGKRYSVDNNAIISTGGGGANFFPGSIAGTISNGGIYL